eukprot:TRINITY_DN2548_c0_g1_i6.p1 TRINITY_DN2548_c0_g1~~TRINITY_DN2548_c0_g1_i6.p1  ORF type:complete len:159 (-),score=11.76 TRINITY_DN2548_c0_g1_i6:214-690(-)
MLRLVSFCGIASFKKEGIVASKMALSLILLISVVTLGFSGDVNSGKPTPSLPSTNGIVAHINDGTRKGLGEAASGGLNERLHFCVFENGNHDVIYVGTKYGGWYNGEFDLSFRDKVVFTGKVNSLVFEGQIIDMGNVISTTGQSNFDLKITRVTGRFK